MTSTPPPEPTATAPTPPGATPARGGARPGTGALLPSDIDPTVFDEGFLRQLQRLGLLMKQPARTSTRASSGSS